MALQLAIDSLAAAALYALVAVGVQVAHAGSGVLHLANGDAAMSGALLTAVVAGDGIALPLAAAAGIACGAAVGLLFERLLVAPVVARAAVAPALLVLGGVVTRQVLVTLLDRPAYPLPAIETTWRVGDGVVHAADLLTVGILAVAGAAVAAVVARSRLGAALRATAADPAAAELAGVSTARVRGAAFAVAAALGVLAVVVAAGRITPSPAAGAALGLKGVAAALVGGLRSPLQACAGALVIGAVEVVGAYELGGGAGEAMVFATGAAALVVRGRRGGL